MRTKETSKNEWIEQISKELKGLHWEDKFIPLTSEVKIAPAIHFTDKPANPSTPISKFHSKARIGLYFEISDEKKGNKELLANLKLGLNAPCLEFHNQELDIDQLLEGVYLDMVEWHFKSSSSDHQSIIDKFLKLGATVFVQTNNTSAADRHKQFEQFIQALKRQDEKADDQVFYFSCPIGEDYLTEIAKFRAFRKIYENYLFATNQEQRPFYLNAFTTPNSLSEDQYTQMIAHTTMAMSASIGGVDRIEIQTREPEQSFQRRMACNLIHILELENSIYHITDPLRGSYWMEEATNRLARHYWKAFQQLY
jgi:hypothetical protein